MQIDKPSMSMYASLEDYRKALAKYQPSNNQCSGCNVPKNGLYQIAEPSTSATPTIRQGAVYISGPMTGIADLNFPAFNSAAELLRGQGRVVVNPAEYGVIEGAQWADYLRADLAQLLQCEAIYLLPGWSKSRGAKLEHHVATALGLRVEYADGAEREGCSAQSENIISAIDALVLAAFTEGGCSEQRTSEARIQTELRKKELLALLANAQELEQFIEQAGDVHFQRCRLGSIKGPIRWDVSFGHHGIEVRGKTLQEAIAKALAAQAKQGGV